MAIRSGLQDGGLVRPGSLAGEADRDPVLDVASRLIARLDHGGKDAGRRGPGSGVVVS